MLSVAAVQEEAVFGALAVEELLGWIMTHVIGSSCEDLLDISEVLVETGLDLSPFMISVMLKPESLVSQAMFRHLCPS